MKQRAIAYWLIPAEPARRSLQRTIIDFAYRYDAPVFEPHMTVHVGSDRVGIAEEVVAKIAATFGPFAAKRLDISHSDEFVKTLFVQFVLNPKLTRLNRLIRNTAKDSFSYELKPHLSLLYRNLPIAVRRALAESTRVPFLEVTFDTIKAVQCISPTQTAAEVQAWRVVSSEVLDG